MYVCTVLDKVTRVELVPQTWCSIYGSITEKVWHSHDMSSVSKNSAFGGLLASAFAATTPTYWHWHWNYHGLREKLVAEAKSAAPLPRIVVFSSVDGGGRIKVNDLRARRAREGARARNRAPPLFITLRAARSAPATRGGADAAFRAVGAARCENNAHRTTSPTRRRQYQRHTLK